MKASLIYSPILSAWLFVTKDMTGKTLSVTEL